MDLKHSEENFGDSGDSSLDGRARATEAVAVGPTGSFPRPQEPQVLSKRLSALASFGVFLCVRHLR